MKLAPAQRHPTERAGQVHPIWEVLLPQCLSREAVVIERHIEEGRFQRSLALVAGAASAVGGLEVAYEHYKGSYGQKIMWTPVVLSGAMTFAGLGGACDPRFARSALRWISGATLLDSLVGFGFHIRGIARKPGGWGEPVANIVMGPPLFAPLLFGVSAYLGLIASFLQPEAGAAEAAGGPRWELELRRGRFQNHLAFATALSAFCSGAEALYSHSKTRFRYRAQWTPVVIAPALVVAALASIRSSKVARTWLPAVSLLAIADGAAGFYFHARGVMRRPGGLQKPLYNVMYGPPIFAPLLLAACGALGLLACLMRKERK